MFVVDTESAIERLMRFLAVEGVTGREAKIGKELVAALKEAGVPARSIRFDDAHTRIPLPTETGNLIVDLPAAAALEVGRAAALHDAPGHRAAVRRGEAEAAGQEDRQRGQDGPGRRQPHRLRRAGDAGRRAPAAEAAHPPLTLLFTVREESGLWGARHVRPADLGGVTMGFNFDGRSAADVVIGAVGADRWEVEIVGKASHAGVRSRARHLRHHDPGRGARRLSAPRAGSARSRRTGAGHQQRRPRRRRQRRPGRRRHQRRHRLRAGAGESRSHDAKFFREITAAYKAAFNEAAAKVTNSEGKAGRVKFTTRTDYHPFRLKETAPVVRRAVAAVAAQGHAPNVRVTNGGLDANWMVRHGIPTVTFGAGQNEMHTVDEWIDLAEFESACRLAVELATRAA